MKFTTKQIKQAFNKAQSRSDVCRILGFAINGSGIRRVNKWIEEYAIDISHFDPTGAAKNRQYPLIEKECPVCKKKFIASQGSPREKQTCSYACSNTYFRQGKRNGRWRHGKCFKRNGNRILDPEYRTICFKYYDKQCAICGWDKSVDVHHIDGNNKNNDPKNLIPLCANHHRLTVMLEYKDEIDKQIQDIVQDNFI
jgi:hypothetical protein